MNKTARKLSEGGAQEFHTIFAKLLFLFKGARTYILTGVAFPTARVREPEPYDNKNWGAY